MAPRQTAPTDDAPPPLAGKQPTSVANPIGVPFYKIDPNTGQPLIGPDGQPVRWSADVGVESPGWQHGFNDVYGAALGTTQSVAPRYFDGDEWVPGSLPPNQIAALQKAMIAAGLAKPGQLALGVWDMDSMQAYSKILAFANSSGLDANTALVRWQKSHEDNPDAGTPRQPLVVRTSNPDDLRQVFRKTVIDTLGQGWDQAKIDRMVSAYQQVETEAQQQQYAMTGSGSSTDPGQGGTITQPPSAQAFAETQARAEDPNMAQEHDTLGFVDQFQNLVGKWA